MDFPSEKRHRLNRRALGRGQYPTAQSVNVAVAGSGTTVTITCSAPVVVTGLILFFVPPLAVTAQTQPDPSIIVLTMSGPLAGLQWTMPNRQPNLSSPHGGPVTGGNGSFTGSPPTATSITHVTNGMDGSYEIEWDNNVVLAGGPPEEPNILVWSPANGVWIPSIGIGQSAANEVTIDLQTFATDGTILIVADAPLVISATPPINVMQGPIPIM